MTCNLFDLIIELCPSLTSMGLAENIKCKILFYFVKRDAHQKSELHLLEYKQRMLKYIENATHRRVSPFEIEPLVPFSAPCDKLGYADNPISDDLISDVYLEFSEYTRKFESEAYLQTLTGCF